MPKELSRKEEQRGTRDVILWGVSVGLLLCIAMLAFFLLWPGQSETSPNINDGDQNSGVNAPLDTAPPVGTEKDEENGGTKFKSGTD